MKKLILILALALQFAGVVSVASATSPMPRCLPCPVSLR